MSREIKFRAWDKKDKYCHYDVAIYPNNKVAIKRYNVESMMIEAEYGATHWTELGDDTLVEQYTGLKDKNGKEIYEGDIVRVSYGYNYEVRQFRTGAWRIGRDDLCVWADSSEVIGNIHENPELLEEAS